MSKLLLSSSLLAVLLSPLVQADTSTIDQTFFNMGGPSKAPATVAVATPATAVKQAAPMPDPALFTQVKNLSEQSSDNAVDIFGLGKRAAANNTNTVATTTAPDGTTVAASTATTQTGMPDPSLFTNPGTPNEQTRDHPFKLF
ncbi:hypothetical protein [uncultured Thiothrix sp.]|uniref:hypothetical protein n=1 Tax=uncultured Thiothrix sp. TaxID=223185 RepID=UPI002639F034|nr:hypothetical protein [uncultured Thiothrix sp.]